MCTIRAKCRWTVDNASIFSVDDGKRLAQTPHKPLTFYERIRLEKQQKAAIETPLVKGIRLLPEFTPGRAMLWGSILAVWGTAALVVSTAKSLDIKTVTFSSHHDVHSALQIHFFVGSWLPLVIFILCLQLQSWQALLGQSVVCRAVCTRYSQQGNVLLLAVLCACCASHQARLACSLDTQYLPCLHVLQTEDASDKLREVIAPMASQFSTALTPLKSAVRFRPSLHKWECGMCCCMRVKNSVSTSASSMGQTSKRIDHVSNMEHIR